MDALHTVTTGSSTRPYGTRSLDETLSEVLASTTRAVDHLEHAGVLVGRPPEFVSAATSDSVIAEVHGLHVVLGEGPCLDAMATGLTVVSDALTLERRWPRFTGAALAAGVQATVAVPLVWEGRTLGALGLYWEGPHQLDTATLSLAESCGVTASALVGWARSAQELQHALRTREMIGQAVGVLMQRYGLSSEAAFSFLRRNSQNANIKLRDVAARFLETGELPQPPRTGAPAQSPPARPRAS
jgi:hypothetical protein